MIRLEASRGYRKTAKCCILALLLAKVGNGCPVQKVLTLSKPLTSDAQPKTAIPKAEEREEDDCLILPEILLASTEAHPDEITLRADLGSTANFSCEPSVPGGSFDNLAVLQEIRWSHQSRMIYSNATAPVSFAHFYYSHARTAHSVYLFIHNVTSDSAGSVKCFKMCPTQETNYSCLVRQYELIPILRAKDVFFERMENATAQSGQLSFTCRASVNCPGESDQHFIWKYGDAFAAAPTGHYFRQIYRFQELPLGIIDLHVSSAVSGFGATGRVCEATLRIEASEFFPPPTLPVACWVRVHPNGREWCIQRAYAYFPQRTPGLAFQMNEARPPTRIRHSV